MIGPNGHRTLRRAVGSAGLSAALFAVVQSPTGPVLALAVGPVLNGMLVLAEGLLAVAVLTLLVLVGGLSCNTQRRRHAIKMVELLTYFWHRRARPDLDLVPAATSTAQSLTRLASSTRPAQRRRRTR